RPVALGEVDALLDRLDDPLRLAQHGAGVNGAGHAVKDATVGSAEVGGDVTALLRPADDLEGGDLLERRAEILVDVLADFGIGESVDTQRFGVVSGEVRVLEVARDVEDEDELLVLLGLGGRLSRGVEELNGCAVAGAGSPLLVSRLGRFARLS